MTVGTITARSTILIVDDDPDIREALGDALEHDGYGVHAVERGSEAIHQVQQFRYGSVILDMGLPDMNGLSVLKLCLQIDPDLPVIVLTGQVTQENTVGSMTKGAFAYITKPYNLDHIRATLRRAVSMRTLTVKAETAQSALFDSEERFRCVVQSAGEAIIIADDRGHIISWNPAAERLFGYSEAEVVGRPLTLLMPARYREPHQQGLERIRATGASRLIGKTVELHGLNKAGEEFPLELSLTTWKTKSGTFYSGIIRDITERKRVERRLAAQHTVTHVLADSPSLREATPQILQAICTSLSWELGAIWSVEGTDGLLRCQEIWHDPSINLAAFIRETFATSFASGIGLPGRVWANGKPAWIPDVVQDANFPRAHIAAKEGLHGAFGFPIRHGREVLGVMEFFSRIIQPPDDELLQMLSAIGSQIGQFMVRKHAEESLRETKERFRQLAEHIREVFWMTDPEKNQIIYISPGYEDTWGRSRESLIQAPRSWLEAIHPDDRNRVQQAALSKQVTGDYDEEYRIIRPDGTLRWIQDRGFPIRDGSGRVYRIAGIAEDITERKEAQEGLRIAYDKLDTILASLPCAILIVNKELQVVYANSLASLYFCQKSSALVGIPITQFIPLDHASWTEEDFTQDPDAQIQDLPDQEFEFQKRRYRYRRFPVTIRGNGPSHQGLVIWDVTEQKLLQDHLIQSEKLASLGTLVFGMAHEINNPVQGILGMAEIILEERDPEKIQEYARDIKKYSTHIATIVRDCAGYARPPERDQEAEIDLRERLEDATKMVRRNPQFGNVQVVTEFQSVPRFHGRRAEIDQVFVNLISNAVQAMEGRGTLVLKTQTESGCVTAEIADTGPGIPKDSLTKIFDPFFTTKDPGKGTGLGLSIAFRIVAKYGGRILVDSEEGKGTTFRVTFPLGQQRKNPFPKPGGA